MHICVPNEKRGIISHDSRIRSFRDDGRLHARRRNNNSSGLSDGDLRLSTPAAIPCSLVQDGYAFDDSSWTCSSGEVCEITFDLGVAESLEQVRIGEEE